VVWALVTKSFLMSQYCRLYQHDVIFIWLGSLALKLQTFSYSIDNNKVTVYDDMLKENKKW
jgi:hypothetical protein